MSNCPMVTSCSCILVRRFLIKLLLSYILTLSSSQKILMLSLKNRFLIFSPLPLALSLFSGWLDCPASGQPIDKVIPSKVPLDETFNESVPPGKRYSPKQVVNKQRKAGRDVSTILYSHDTNAHSITYYVIGWILCFFPVIWPYFEACIFE